MASLELTPAERNIIELMLSGKRIDQVASVRGSSRATVVRQLENARLKAGARTLIQLGAWAEWHGIREAGAG